MAADMALLIRSASEETRGRLNLALTSLDASVDVSRAALGRELSAMWGIRPKDDEA